MKNVKIEKIAKALEAERDHFLGHLAKNVSLHDRAIISNLNVFFTLYTLTLTRSSVEQERSKVESYSDPAELFESFYTINFNAIRFLLELFLLSVEILSKKTDKERFFIICSMSLSEKINFHAMDKLIFLSDMNNKEFFGKLDKNQSAYKSFIDFYVKPSPLIPSPLIPDCINDFFDKDGGLKISNRKEFLEKFGFEYYRHSKINFGHVLEQNYLLKKMVTDLVKQNILPNIVDVNSLKRLFYSMLSIQNHPTYSALEEVERFIGKDAGSQKDFILSRMEVNAAFLKVVGVLMLNLYAGFRVSGGFYENFNF